MKSYSQTIFAGNSKHTTSLLRDVSAQCTTSFSFGYTSSTGNEFLYTYGVPAFSGHAAAVVPSASNSLSQALVPSTPMNGSGSPRMLA